MDELLDILNADGKATGKVELKSYAHRMGLFHATVHIWFYTDDGSILLQQRGKNKTTHPLLWDVSVAGHIAAGESVEISALREIEEEIGITVNCKSLKKIGIFKSIQKHHSNLIDCEFHHTFLCKLTVPFEILQKQESEVEALKLIPIARFRVEIENIKNFDYVPHDGDYYKTMSEEITKCL